MDYPKSTNNQLSLFLDSPRVVFFDLETLRSAEEVGGWKNISKMGMACGVCFDSQKKEYFIYEEKEVNHLLQHLISADLVIGFNHLRFDYEVLSAYSDQNLRRLNNFDLLEDLTQILGHRVKLDSLARATLGVGKSSSGLQSLMWVKEGRLDLVKEYCKQDVEVTRDVFEFGEKQGFVWIGQEDQKVQVPVSWNSQRLIQNKASS